MVQDESIEEDVNIYEIDCIRFVIGKDEEKEVAYLEIDYIDDWAGKEFVITAGF